jgi:hypothetical protein
MTASFNLCLMLLRGELTWIKLNSQWLAAFVLQ